MPMIPMISNPGRPPKAWFKKCVSKTFHRSPTVRAEMRARVRGIKLSPQRLCGHVWYHKLSPAKRKELTLRYERGNPMKCITCGKSFIPVTPTQDACSRSCLRAFVIRETAKRRKSQGRKINSPTKHRPPRIYVGVKAGKPREIFYSVTVPTKKTHGDRYASAIGPFRTKRAAALMIRTGTIAAVADAERVAMKEHARGRLNPKKRRSALRLYKK